MFIFLLTRRGCLVHNLNMFNSVHSEPQVAGESAGEKTKELIFEKALGLFREQGFEFTTMREIARAAKVATGAAYYYFEGKEAIVSAYYQQVLRRHAAKVRQELSGKAEVRDRIAIILHSKLEILKGDRKFLGALFRYAGEPGHPLSVFGKETEEQRRQSVEIFREALAGAELSDESRELLPWAMWLAHLGVILYFLHDESEGQAKTHRLVERFAEMVAGFVGFTSSAAVRPLVKPFQSKMLSMLREAGLGGQV